MTKKEFKAFLYDVCSDCDCHRDNKYCTLIEFLCGPNNSHRTIIQLKCVEKLRYERHEDLSWDESFKIWIDKGYAETFAEVYDEKLNVWNMYQKVIKANSKKRS